MNMDISKETIQFEKGNTAELLRVATNTPAEVIIAALHSPRLPRWGDQCERDEPRPRLENLAHPPPRHDVVPGGLVTFRGKKKRGSLDSGLITRVSSWSIVPSGVVKMA